MITFLAPEIVKLFATSDYYEAIYIMPPIAAGIYLTSVSNMYSNILVYRKKSSYIMYASIIAATTNIFLNYICIPKFGYMAAAYTTLVAHSILAFMQIYYVRRTEKRPNAIYQDHYILLVSVITILCAMIGIPLYRFMLLRYLVILFGTLLGCYMAYRTFKMMKNR